MDRRSRSPQSPFGGRLVVREDEHEEDREREAHREKGDDLLRPTEAYSASLRLASLESLTGKMSAKAPPLPFSIASLSGLTPAKASPPSSTSPRVPDLPQTPSLPPAYLGALSSPSPLHQLLSSAGANPGGTSIPGLPKPADLIQQAQALQLLAHLQTMLMNPGSASLPPPPPPPQANQLQNHFQNAANLQKVREKIRESDINKLVAMLYCLVNSR